MNKHIAHAGRVLLVLAFIGAVALFGLYAPIRLLQGLSAGFIAVGALYGLWKATE